jgi:hypothetical protein
MIMAAKSPFANRFGSMSGGIFFGGDVGFTTQRADAKFAGRRDRVY